MRVVRADGADLGAVRSVGFWASGRPVPQPVPADVVGPMRFPAQVARSGMVAALSSAARSKAVTLWGTFHHSGRPETSTTPARCATSAAQDERQPSAWRTPVHSARHGHDRSPDQDDRSKGMDFTLISTKWGNRSPRFSIFRRTGKPFQVSHRIRALFGAIQPRF